MTAFEQQVAAALDHRADCAVLGRTEADCGPCDCGRDEWLAARVAAAIDICERIAWGSTQEANHDFAKERALAALKGER